MTETGRNAWIEQARNADTLHVAQELGAVLKRVGIAEWVGPCPRCGGEDRFSINVMKRLFNCRGSEGGDVIQLVEHVTGCSFIEAIERINGTLPPDGAKDEPLGARAAHGHQRRDEAESAKVKRDKQAVADVLARAVPIWGTHGEAYLRAGRRLSPPRRLMGDIRFVGDLDYWGVSDNGSGEIVHLATLPAVVAVIRDVSGAVIGISQTYLDPKEPRKWKPTGSPANSPKKIRGAKQGGMIRLGRPGETLALSEGWENALAWFQLGHGPKEVSLAAAVDLGNLAGRSSGTVGHPVLTVADGRPAPIPNGIPDPDHPGVILPEGILSVILLADLDSETYATVARLRTAGQRFVNKGISVEFAWPSMNGKSMPGKDWNDILIDATQVAP
jgi:hypothetical protein